MKTKYFLTDFDGTISKLFNPESKKYVINGIYDFFSKYNIEESIKELNDPFKIWIRSYNKISSILTDCERRKVFIDSSKIFLNLEKEAAASSEPYENIYETYIWIKNNFIDNGIVSTNHSEAIKIALERSKIYHLIGPILGRESINNFAQLKPNPFLLEKALKKLGSENINTLYIGDNEVDMKAAKEAKIFSVGILRGRDRERTLLEAGANLVIDNFYDLIKIEKKL